MVLCGSVDGVMEHVIEIMLLQVQSKRERNSFCTLFNVLAFDLLIYIVYLLLYAQKTNSFYPRILFQFQ